MTWRLCTRYLCTNINIHEWARTRSSQHSSINLSSPAKANDTIANLWELKWRAGDGKIFRYIHPQDTFCIHKYQDTWQIPCSFELRYTVGCDMYIHPPSDPKRGSGLDVFADIGKLNGMKNWWSADGVGRTYRPGMVMAEGNLQQFVWGNWKDEKLSIQKKIKKINKYNGIIPEHTNTSNTMWDANIFVAFGWKILFS